MEEILPYITHEYMLVFYGVILWQIEQISTAWITKKPAGNRIPFIIRSMLWGGIFVIFDDEMLTRYNAIANVDYDNPPWWMYVIIGFLVDFVRTYFFEKKNVSNPS